MRGDGRDPGAGPGDERRDPTDPPPPVGQAPIRRRTPTIPYGGHALDLPEARGSEGGAKKPGFAIQGLRAKLAAREAQAPPEKLRSGIPLGRRETPFPESVRYEKLAPTVEFTQARDISEEAYNLDEALAPHLAWLVDDQGRGELFKHLARGDHARALAMMTEERRRYPRNLSIGRCIQIVERAAIARLLTRLGPLELLPERFGSPQVGREAATLAELVDGHSTFEDILRASPFPRLRSLELLADLLRRQAILVRDDLTPTGDVPPVSGRPPPRASDLPSRSKAPMRPRLEADLPQDPEHNGRITLADPVEVATRAAALFLAEEEETAPRASDLPVSKPTVREMRSVTPRSPFAATRGSGFRPAADDPVAKTRTRLGVGPASSESDLPLPQTGGWNRISEGAPRVIRPSEAKLRSAPTPAALPAARSRRTDDPAPISRRKTATDFVAVTEIDSLPPLSVDERAEPVIPKAPPMVSLRAATLAGTGAGPPLSTLRSPRQPSDAPIEVEPSYPSPGPQPPIPVIELESPPAPPISEKPSTSAPVVLPDVAGNSVPPRSAPSITVESNDAPMSTRSMNAALEDAPPSLEPRSMRLATRDPFSDIDEEEPRKRSTALFALAGLALMLSGVAVWVALSKPPLEARPVAASSAISAAATEPRVGGSAAPTTTSAAIGEPIKLSIDASPKGVHVYLDDQLLRGERIERSLPRDGKSHVVKVEAIGYRPRSTTFAATGDTRLIVALELLPTRAPPTPKPSGAEEIYNPPAP